MNSSSRSVSSHWSASMNPSSAPQARFDPTDTRVLRSLSGRVGPVDETSGRLSNLGRVMVVRGANPCLP
jgi:hypothetical protein